MSNGNRPRLAAVLFKYREFNCLTQQFIADKIGITRSAYTYYETGKTEPSMETLCRLQKLLNIPYAEFFEDDSETDCALGNKNANCKNGANDDTSAIAMAMLSSDEKDLVSNYRLADAVTKRKARNLLDPEYQELLNKKKKLK